MKYLRKIVFVLSVVLTSNYLSGQSHGWTVNPSEFDFDMEITALVIHGTTEVVTGTLGVFVGGVCRGFEDGIVAPTGKTVFIVRCYSDQLTGETLTFRYYDSGDDLFYEIPETAIFTHDTQLGNAISPLQFHTLPLIFAVTGGGSYCVGESGLPVGLDDSETGVTYTLLKNGAPQTGTVEGSTGNPITFGNQLAGTYTVSGTNSGGSKNMTGNAVITETSSGTAGVSISASPSAVICNGTLVTFTAVAVNGGPTPTYQWKLNGSDVGTNSSIYTNSTLSTGDKITCVMTTSSACIAGSPATSNEVTMTVNPIVAASVSVTASANPVCAGTSVTFTANPVGGGTTPSYQWYKNTVAVATGASYTYVPLNGDAVYVVMTSGAACPTGSPATSNTVTMTVNPVLPVSISIVASANPVCAGTTVNFTATAVNGGTTPAYQWKVNGTNVGTNSTTYSYVPLTNDAVTCVLTSNATPCATGSPATSNTITMIVNPILPVSISIVASANPVCSGTSVTFTATPVNGGTAPAYQWRVNGANVGTNSSAYSYTPSNNDAVICILTSNATPCATGSPATSNPVTMTVNTNLPVSVSIVASANPVCAGTTVNFTATAVNGGTTPSFQWKVNGANVGTNSPTYSYAPLNNDVIGCTLTSSATPCATGSPATSNTISMTVNPNLLVSVSIVASENPVCAGTAVNFTATPVNGGTTPAYQWRVNGANVGTNSPAYSYVPSNNDVVRCILTSNATPCATGSPATSNVITMTVNPILTASVTIAAVSNPVCSGTSATIIASPNNGGSTPAYQWRVNGINAGANSTSLTYTPSNGDIVTCIMTSNAACITSNPATSNSITMTVNSILPASVSVSASANPVCSGTSVTFTATPTNGGSTPLYQWKLNGANVGTNSPTYSNASLANGNTVSCTMTSNLACVTGSPATSNTITMTVNPNLPVSVSVSASSNPICAGTSVIFTATPANEGTAPVYQWKLNGANVGTNSPTYTSSSLSNNDQVSCVLTSNATCATGSPATSNVITMTVNPNLIASVQIGTTSTSVCTGTSATFIALAINGGTTPVYQWKVNGVNVGTSNASYSYPPVDGDIVTCVLTSNATCVTGSPATSNAITMSVNSILPVSVSIAASSNPSCSGASVTFTASPVNGGTAPTYQWYKNTVAVATGVSYTYVPVNGDAVYVVLTSSLTCATGSPATSNVVTMTVNPNLPASVSIAASSNPICSGTSVTFTATPTNGGTTPVYQWRLNGANVGTNSNTYTNAALANGALVTCVMTSNATCVTGSPATSNTITMTVNPNLPVSLLIAASSNPICTGASVTFTATPTNGGTTPVYQWKLNGINVGTNSTTYTNTSIVNTDKVTCILTSNANCATGNPATSNEIAMTVNPILPVSVSITASSNPICAGTSVTFTATPTNGGATPSYQWRLNGANVGTNSATYTNAALPNNGRVTCVMTSSATCPSGNPATSNEILMTVNPNRPVSVSIAASSNPICAGTSVTFTATPTNGGTTPVYQWKLNGANVGTSSTTYTNASLVNSDKVTCVLTSNVSCPTGNPDTSNEITMTVNPILPASVSIAASSNPACTGTSVTFTATPTNGGTSPVYQWKVNGANVGTNSPSYSYIPANNAVITCVMTSNAVCATGSPATSNAITMSVSTTLPVSVSIAASSNPACSGNVVTFTATPTNGGPNPVYQWYKNTVPVGPNSSTYSYTPATGDKVYVTLTSNLSCATGNPATSNVVTMTVNPYLPVSVSISASSNPICAGTSVIFTAIPINGGAAPVYQWKLNGVNVGVNSYVYVNDALANGDMVTCVMTSNAICPSGSPATSNVVTMTVNPNLPAGVVVEASANPVCSGTSVTLAATATNGGSAPYYQWKLNGLNVGTNTSEYSYVPSNNDVIICEMTSNEICATGNPISDGTTFTVNSIPTTPVIGLVAQTTCLSATGSVVLSGLPSDTWTINPGGITGSAESTIITDLLPGSYNYTVTNASGCTSPSSDDVVIQPQPSTPPAPVVETIYQPACSESEGSVVLGGLPSGTWTITHTPGAAAINGTGSGTTVTGLEEGSYDFTVTNSDGCTSVASESVIIIKPIVPAVVITNPEPVCSPATVDLTSASIYEGSSEVLSFTYWINQEATLPLSDPGSAGNGTYYIKGTSTSGCWDIRPVTVTVRQMAVADAGTDKILEYLFGTTMDALSPNADETGNWSLLSGKGEIADAADSKTSVSGLSIGRNKFIWAVTNGVCPASSDTVTITVNDLVIPTLITPNLDGKNDYFVLRGIETLGRTELVIFDRRGAQVYKNSDYDNRWDGVDYNENPLPDDTYFFTIKSQNGKSLSGYIVIRR